LHHFHVTADYVKFLLATGGRYTLMPSLGVIPANIAISDILLKTRFFRQHFTHRMYGVSSTLLRNRPQKLPNSVK